MRFRRMDRQKNQTQYHHCPARRGESGSGSAADQRAHDDPTFRDSASGTAQVAKPGACGEVLAVYFFFPPPLFPFAWARSDPATLFSSFVDFGLVSCLDAFDASVFEVAIASLYQASAASYKSSIVQSSSITPAAIAGVTLIVPWTRQKL